MGWIPCWLGVLGFLILLRTRSARERLFLSWPIAYFLLMAAFKRHEKSWMLPMIPFVSILAVVPFRERTRATWIAGVLLVLALMDPGVRSLRQTLTLAGQDTRTVAARWITEHEPGGARIVADIRALDLDPSKYPTQTLHVTGYQPIAKYQQEFDYLVISSYWYDQYFLEANRSYWKDSRAYYTHLLSLPPEVVFKPGGEASTGPVVHIFDLRRLPRLSSDIKEGN